MSGAVIDPHAADRLVKLCGMMGSDHAGERAVAAAKANELVRRLGLTWGDIISVPPLTESSSLRSTTPRPSSGMTDWQRMAHYCRANHTLLNAREREFVHDARGWRRPPTEKQAKWLCDIYARIIRARSSAE